MFLESPRFPLDLSFDKPGGPGFNADVQVLESGFEQRNQFWPESRIEFDIGYGTRELYKVQNVLEFFENVGGMEHGFRIRDYRSYKSCRITSAGSNGDVDDVITSLDQVISVDTTTTDIFQLIKTSRNGPFARKKTISKPVTGTVLLAIQGITIPTTRYDLLYVPVRLAREGHETTGRITLATNIQKTISAITSAAAAKITTTTNHGLSVNDSVHIGSVSGMTGINGMRGLVTIIDSATQFTVAIDSTGLGTYTSGGQINTQRQSTSFTVSVAGVSKQAFATVTSSGAHGLVAGDIGVFASVGGMTQLNAATAVVRQVLSPTTFRIDINSVEYTTYTSGGTFSVAERVTAGYEYDMPARFNTNNFPMDFLTWEAGGVQLPVVELRVI